MREQRVLREFCPFRCFRPVRPIEPISAFYGQDGQGAVFRRVIMMQLIEMSHEAIHDTYTQAQIVLHIGGGVGQISTQPLRIQGPHGEMVP